MNKIQGYGRVVDLPDHRDRLYHEHNEVSAQVPAAYTISAELLPPIYDQGQLGSCTGNGWARVMEYMANQDGDNIGTPSRLYIYYYERVLEGTVNSDSGAQIRDGAKVLANRGVPPETDWPYDISKFAWQPPQVADTDAQQHKALVYERLIVGKGTVMRSAVAAGLPIVFGFSVPDYFEQGWDPTSQPLRLPTQNDSIIGGHCVVVTGYDFSRTRFPNNVFLCDNSWGPNWGIGGRFWMDAEWFNPSRGLAGDLWVVQKAS